MRNEESTLTGIQADEPQSLGLSARDDFDVIPAGLSGPASGNAISGAGTISGSAGADALGSGKAMIIAVQGAGGTDSSFSGGQLSVEGKYGTLRIDAQGNYQYVRNADSPRGVTDVFNYTLADKAGATDTARLAIRIEEDPEKLAQAEQIVVGPDGVVVLPAGVSLADIVVSGRNLIINMPDGTQKIIVDGAVFVPQLVLDGVEVPATNLASLLIDSEPQPAAGTPQSSGGNFEVPVAPLDPGVPLGDLLPPTELGYVPPDFEEVQNPVRQDEAPVVLVQPDGSPAALAATDSVDEGALPARIIGGQPEPAGSHAESTDESTSGLILFTSPDGVATIVLTVNGSDYVVAGPGAVTSIPGAYGTLTITSVNLAAGTIGYSYTLADNTVGDSTQENIVVRLTDPDGDVASATLTITIADDVPTARADVDTDTVASGSDGNVITGVGTNTPAAMADTVGADNAEVTNIVGHLAATDGRAYGDAGDVSMTVLGQYGSLQINADGSYEYTRTSGPGGATDTFTYTLTDGDGDTSVTTLSIVLQDAAPTVSVTDLTVDEKGLPLGTGEQADFGLGPVTRATNNSDTSEKSSVGTMTITSLDGTSAVEVKDSGGVWVNVTAGTIGSPVLVTGTHGTLAVWSDGAGNFSYTYTLTSNYGTHPDTIVDGDGISGTADPLAGDSFAVRVTDGDGDQSTSTPLPAGTIDVTVLDDAPVVYAGPAVLNIINGGTVSGTANFDFAIGADQRSSYSAVNSDFTAITLTGMVGANSITNATVTWVSETSTTAVYNISFNYLSGTTVKLETGTLTFDKATGSYTVDLATPIANFPSTSNASAIVGYEDGPASPGIVDGSQPMVSVASLTNGVFVQFTGYNDSSADLTANGTVGDYTFANGDTVIGTRAFVSVSNEANGVAGDTMGKAEFLDMDFFTTNPYGNTTLAPDAQVQSIFFKFDGIGNNEDMIIILKLMDPDDGTLTTKAIYVANGDIYKQGQVPTTSPFAAIPLDNNDGLVVIEPNDYNLLPGENWVIVGAQISATDEGISGTAIDLDRDFGADSTSTATANINNDVNDTGFKISDIGFFTEDTQNAELDFAFQLKDSEGDLSAVQHLIVNVVTPVVLDTNHDGRVEYLGREAGVVYDYDGDGRAESTAWAGAGDSILVRDANGDGTVTNASEFVFGHDGLTDLQALQATYGDTLDSNDADYAAFMVWNDANSNGIADAGELQSLAEAGITSISLVSDGVASIEADGDVRVAGNGSFTYVNDNGDEATGTLGDAAFVYTAGEAEQRSVNQLLSSGATAAAVAAFGLSVAAMTSGTDFAASDADLVSTGLAEAGFLVGVAGVAAEAGATGSNHSLIGSEQVVPANDEGGAGANASNAATASAGLDSSTGADDGGSPGALAEGTVLADHADATVDLSGMAVMADAAAGLDVAAEAVQHNQVVGKIVLEAVDEAGAIDAAIANLGGADSLVAMASPAADAVSGWDTGDFGQFTASAFNAMTMEAMLHQDAIQLNSNG